jgi:branched-chain amino acid transport system substrate-binding protein
MVAMPLVGADFLPLVTTANEDSPDAIVVLTADTGCVPTMQAAADLGVTAPLFLTGACAAPKILADAGDAAEGRYFNVEGPIRPDDPDPDTALYNAVVERYGEGLDAPGAGTVSFRSLMNLYVVLRDLGPDAVTPEAIVEAFRAARDVPSFMGHPYTCDGEQLAGLAAMCAPQQIIARFSGGALEQVSDWIQVSELAG